MGFRNYYEAPCMHCGLQYAGLLGMTRPTSGDVDIGDANSLKSIPIPSGMRVRSMGWNAPWILEIFDYLSIWHRKGKSYRTPLYFVLLACDVIDPKLPVSYRLPNHFPVIDIQSKLRCLTWLQSPPMMFSALSVWSRDFSPCLISTPRILGYVCKISDDNALNTSIRRI